MKKNVRKKGTFVSSEKLKSSESLTVVPDVVEVNKLVFVWL
jgi:hypothetical protein